MTSKGFANAHHELLQKFSFNYKQTNEQYPNPSQVVSPTVENVENSVEKYIPPRERLNGLSVQKARLYGLPHINAEYKPHHIDNSYTMTKGAACPVCGLPATNVHHVPTRRTGMNFTLSTPWGKWNLRPALIALCGSGTTGCHGLIHCGKLKVDWEWDYENGDEDWFEGRTLSAVGPHSPAIYDFGKWIFTKENGEKIEWRG